MDFFSTIFIFSGLWAEKVWWQFGNLDFSTNYIHKENWSENSKESYYGNSNEKLLFKKMVDKLNAWVLYQKKIIVILQWKAHRVQTKGNVPKHNLNPETSLVILIHSTAVFWVSVIRNCTISIWFIPNKYLWQKNLLWLKTSCASKRLVEMR